MNLCLQFRDFSRSWRLMLALALLSVGINVTSMQAAPTNVTMRDPSTIVKRAGTYWIYGTGFGVQQFSSTDRLNWTKRGPVFPTPPAWVATAVPGNQHNGSWAPDIAFWGGEYHLYYSYSTLGSNHSAIGLATNPTLDPNAWVDRGIVIQSDESTPFNTIDPGVFQDGQGKWWLSFGSYFDGIHLIPLDTRTGKRLTGSVITRTATRPGVPGNAIEASDIAYHDGWYYLFVNWGSCLQGERSTYTIRVGRSRDVTGPYADKTGQRMLDGGGSLFLGSVIDDGNGKPFDDQVGPGHAGILHDDNGDYLSTHYEWSRFLDGKTTVNVNALAWDSDGWPRVVLDVGPYHISGEMARHNVLEVVGEPIRGAVVQTEAYEATPGQKWTLAYRGDGAYTLGSSNGLVLSTVGGVSAPGTKVELAPFQNADWQKWYLRQNEDGTYSLLLLSGGKQVALDVPGGSNLDGAPMQVWTDNYSYPQKWTFHLR